MLTRVYGRICTSAVHSWRHGSYRVLGGTVSPRWSSSSQRDDIQGSGTTVNLSSSAGSQPLQVEGYQGNMHEFSAGRSQDIIDRAREQMGMTAEERHASVQQGVQDADMEAAYSHTSNVSLHSVMQDGVPYPTKAQPNQRNMPNHGGIMEKGMYTSGQYADNHPSKPYKSYSTYSGAQGNQDMRGTKIDAAGKVDDRVQGIQSNPDQDSDRYSSYSGAQGMQDMRGTKTHDKSDAEEQFQGVQGSAIDRLRHASNPCPQGIQGHDCDRFKVWLNNCIKYGLVNCDQQLQGVQTGRKTLSDIFEEQDKLIRQAAVSAGKQRA